MATNCSQLKMQSADGKFYKTDVADTEQLFRLIQSIPSPKAEPFKLWLPQVAAERLDETQYPELSIDRAFRGSCVLNPAKAELMYYPNFMPAKKCKE